MYILEPIPYYMFEIKGVTIQKVLPITDVVIKIFLNNYNNINKVKHSNYNDIKFYMSLKFKLHKILNKKIF